MISCSSYSFFPHFSKCTRFFSFFGLVDIVYNVGPPPCIPKHTQTRFEKSARRSKKKHFFTGLFQTREKTHFGQNTRMQETKVTPILNNTSCILLILTMREKTCNYRTSLAKDPIFYSHPSFENENLNEWTLC